MLRGIVDVSPPYTGSSWSSASEDAVLVYDGLCVMCNAAIRFVLRHDRSGAIRFATLQGAYATGLRERHPELKGVDSIIFVHRDGNGRKSITTRSAAALELSRYLGKVGGALRLLRFVPAPLRDTVYDAVARVRYRAFGKLDACPLPDPSVRSRFID